MSDKDIGNNSRITSSVLKRLQELMDPITQKLVVASSEDELFADDVQVIVTSGQHIASLPDFNDKCRKSNKKLVAVELRGLTGAVFIDLGDKHKFQDFDGVPYIDAIVTNITIGKEAKVTLEIPLDYTVTMIATGSTIEFSDVQGMTEINGKSFVISKIEGTIVTIGDTSGFSKYTGGGRLRRKYLEEVYQSVYH